MNIVKTDSTVEVMEKIVYARDFLILLKETDLLDKHIDLAIENLNFVIQRID